MSKELLEKYGITADEITTENVGEIQNQIEEAVIEKHKNDPKFYESLDPTKLPEQIFKTKYDEAKKAELNETVKTIGKQYNLSADEQKQFAPEDLTDKGKYIAKAYSILMARDNSKAQISKIQTEFAEREEKLTKELEDLKLSLENKEKEVDVKLNQYKVDMAIMTASQKLDKNLIVKSHTGVGIMLPLLKEKYAVIIEGNKALLRNKENPSLRVLVEGTNKDLSIEAAIEQIYKEEEIWKEEQVEPDGNRGRTTYTPDGKPTPFTKDELEQAEREKKLGFT